MDYSPYHVRHSETDELHPEETLADVAVKQHQSVETPIGPGVFRFFYAVVALLALVVLTKSVQLQVYTGQRYALTAARNSYANYLGPAFRGIIYDTHGQPLVENIPVFDLIAYHRDLPTTVEVIHSASVRLSAILDRPADELEKLFTENKTAASWLVQGSLSKPQVAKLAVADLPGLYVVANAQRHYLGGGLLANVLGYTAKVGPAEVAADGYYLLTDRIGRFGLEQYYEKELRGQHRRFDLSKGDPGTSASGNDLILTVDSQLQTQLSRIMANVLGGAGLRRGAAVVQDPRTGAILALVSLPAFDANVFEDSTPANAAQVSKIFQDSGQPLFNRAIGGRYSPGSTIKPFWALVGLKEGAVTPQTTIMANGSITVHSAYDPNVSYTFKDWKVHGLTDLKKAIADSVDVYFYALGGGYGNIHGVGAEKMVDYLKGLWADRTLGIDLPGEVSGFVPSPQWKKQNKGEDWFIGDTYNISIGQGDLGVTPLWLNAYVGAIANGGELMRPYLVKTVQDADGKMLSTTQPQILAELPFDAQTLNIVRAGMRQAVTTGTATLLNDLSYPVAAKTGTAQVTGAKLNSLFITYGPTDHPTIALTVLVEHVSGQGLAIRIAHDFLAWYFQALSVK